MIHGGPQKLNFQAGARYFDSEDQIRRYLSVGNWFKSRARNHEYYTTQDIFWIDLIP